MKKIIDGIYYVGANDRTTQLFEALWPIPQGVTYNSYLVAGSEKCALIDGIELSELEHLRQNITEVLPNRAPDYLVINHMEPDHSGAIAQLRTLYPEMTIVGNAKTLDMLKGFYGVEDNVMKIADGDTLDLGGVTLNFRLTPMVHWPETMMTYLPEKKVLFSGDAFGAFGALNGAVVDSDMDSDRYIPEMYRYYASIVGKYGIFVQKAIARFEDTPVEYICPTHGPVWHDRLKEVVGIYDRLSRYEGEDGVTIVYGSMYGNTGRMAEIIAGRLAERGIKKISVHNASKSDLSNILADIFRYRGLIIGAPTYSNSLFPPVKAVVDAIVNREIKNRAGAVFGTFAWGSKAVKELTDALSPTGLLVDSIEPVTVRQAPDSAAADACRVLADALAATLQ